MKTIKGGFTLIEMIIVVVFLGVMVTIAVPRMNFSSVNKQKADTVARKLVTDFRRTRMLAVSDAANNSQGYSLNMTGSAPYTGYNITNLDTLQNVDSHTIDSNISCIGGSLFKFGTYGELLSGSDTTLLVSSPGRSFTITVVPATGIVKLSEN